MAPCIDKVHCALDPGEEIQAPGHRSTLVSRAQSYLLTSRSHAEVQPGVAAAPACSETIMKRGQFTAPWSCRLWNLVTVRCSRSSVLLTVIEAAAQVHVRCNLVRRQSTLLRYDSTVSSLIQCDAHVSLTESHTDAGRWSEDGQSCHAMTTRRMTFRFGA